MKWKRCPTCSRLDEPENIYRRQRYNFQAGKVVDADRADTCSVCRMRPDRRAAWLRLEELERLVIEHPEDQQYIDALREERLLFWGTTAA